MHDEYSPEAILCEIDGHGETKVVHAAHGCITQLLGLCGGFTLQARQPDSWEGWYWGAKHVWGMDPLGQQNQQNNVIKDISEHGDAVLFWGCDPETTPLRLGRLHGEPPVLLVHRARHQADTHLARRELHQRRARRQVDSRAARTPTPRCSWPSPTRGSRRAPTTSAYLDTHAVGFENFRHYVLGGEDGVPKTPKWAERICGVPSYTIKALARYWAAHAVSIAHCNGGSFIRSCLRARARAPRGGAPRHAGRWASRARTSSSSSSGRSSAWTRVTPLPPSVEIPRLRRRPTAASTAASRSQLHPQDHDPRGHHEPARAVVRAHRRPASRARTSSTGPTRSRSRATSACI